MSASAYLSEKVAVGAAIDPQLVDNNNVTSDYIDMSKFERVMFVVQVGATDTTVDAAIMAATDSGGTSAAAVSGKAITQLGATDDNKQAILEINAAEVAALSGSKTHVACKITVGDGSTGAYVSCIGLAAEPRFHPASDNDVASVAEIVQ